MTCGDRSGDSLGTGLGISELTLRKLQGQPRPVTAETDNGFAVDDSGTDWGRQRVRNAADL